MVLSYFIQLIADICKELVYVRTGLSVATLNRDTGYITDNETGLIVAEMDGNSNIVPVVSGNAE